MKAIDTNLVIRLLLDDDPVQSARARGLLSSGDVVIAPTVLLETLWVLASRYGATDEVLLDTMTALARCVGVTIGRGEQAAEFFRLWRGGLDPEDAAHLAFVDEVDAFVTFDRALVKRAKKLGSTVAAELPTSGR
jgi:predicted nucleic-acid-binding protein